MTQDILVTTSQGLDDLLADEILYYCPQAELKRSPGRVQFQGSLEDAYRLCLWSRLANRVVWLLNEGRVESAEALYQIADAVDWSSHLSVNDSFAVRFVGTNKAIVNTQFGALKIKDAIVDHFQQRHGARPSVERQSPDVNIIAFCQRERVRIGIDLCGESLHQRSYRQSAGLAPLKEHVACAILMRSGWTKSMASTLVDPMCGSGTIAIEAALMSTNTAPALYRKNWGFLRWKQHQPLLWKGLLMAAEKVKRPRQGAIYASDNDPRMVEIAKRNAMVAHQQDNIEWSCQEAQGLTLDAIPSGFIVTNPPYGERLGEMSTLVPFFSQWGRHIKSHWQGWQLSLLSSHRELLQLLKLRSHKTYSLYNGKLACQLVNYNLDSDNCEARGLDAEQHEFANRLKKNIKRLTPWIEKQNTNCYRLYDADLPDYNVAIDRYGEQLVVQEYAPPKNIDPKKAQKRLQEVMLYLPMVTGVSSKHIHVKVRAQQKGTQQYEKIGAKGERFEVFENGAKFFVNLTDYLDTGLFLDHRSTRQWVREWVKGKDVLNLFCYTGSVSVFAALGGASSVTSVDMSRTYLTWAEDNFKLNRLKGNYAFIQADCLKWIAQPQRSYDFMFIDPPSFSNSKRMDDTWDVQRDHLQLLTNALSHLRDKGTIVFSTNRRGFKLEQSQLEALGLHVKDVSAASIPEDFKRHASIHKCWVLQR